ncbi:MAG: hypothetical protein KDD47_27765, partial [Acidobacteria bacterium]|nr:hypothetical protein [Acidobacteriota bacterium]
MLWKTQRAARALPVRTLPILTLLILGLGGSPSLARDINIEIWCPDVNRDLFVDARDVQLLMEVWGQSCPTHPEDPHDTCPADVNHNGVVG